MRLRLPQILLIFLTTTLPGFAFCQQIDSMMTTYADSLPVERIHVHFDKSAYNKEETIWYKIYILDSEGLTTLSKNVYVEWFDQAGKMIKRTTSPLFSSTARGSFELPADYTGNFIRARVYTRWSLNEEPDSYYVRDLLINNDISLTGPQTASRKTVLTVFPEGGDLVTGLRSRVAFKATDARGMPVAIKGLLMNGARTPLDTLRVKHDGMGSFSLQPVAGERYMIKWSDPSGDTGTLILPEARKESVTLFVSTNNDFATLKIERTDALREDLRKLILLVHMDRQLLFKADIDLSTRKILRANIPIAELNTGVMQCTIFSADWIPIAERIVFVNNRNHEFGAKLIPQLVTLTKRGKNVFDVYVTDTSLTNMSISVTDASIASSSTAHTIYSDLLLSHEIKGRIHNPGYYLSSDSDEVTANLDLVMLTHGWRRFNWEKLRSGVLPTVRYQPETDYMKVAGKAYGLKYLSTNALMLNLIIQQKDSSKNFSFEPLSKEGMFENKSLYFYDTARIYYSFSNNARLNGQIQMQFDNGLLSTTTKEVQYTEQEKAILWSDTLSRARMAKFLKLQEDWKKRSAYKTLQEVIIKSTAKPKEEVLDQKYSSGMFAGGDAYVFDLVNDPFANSGFDIFTYLQGRVPGLQVNRNGGNITLSWRGSQTDLFLDQIRSDAGMLQNMNVNDIAMVKVFRPPFFGSMGGGSGGAVAIYTKKGGDQKTTGTSSKGMYSTLLAGYSSFKEFYHPQYETPADGPDTDIRTTLYWNPYVITSKTSPRFRVQFYNNDVSNKLHIVLEGVNTQGKMTRTEMTLDSALK